MTTENFEQFEIVLRVKRVRTKDTQKLDWLRQRGRLFPSRKAAEEAREILRQSFPLAIRKAMSTKANPLFEQCLDNAEPDTRAEVRRNMETNCGDFAVNTLAWHKVPEELPEEGQHILMARKMRNGDYLTESIWYSEPNITDNMEYWMPIPEIKED